jgi:hypothetical protein
MSNPEIKSAEDIKRELYMGAEKAEQAKNTEELAAEKIDKDEVQKLQAILEKADLRETLQEELDKSSSKIKELLNKS